METQTTPQTPQQQQQLPQPPARQKPPGFRSPNAPAPRPGTLPPPFYHKNNNKRKRFCCCRHCGCLCCCCIFCLIIFILLILLGTFFAISYIWFNPKPPQLSIESINIPKFDVVPKADGTYLNVHAIVHANAKNPNSKLGVMYGHTNVGIKIEGHDIGTANVPAFEQKAGNTRKLKVESKGSFVLGDGEAVKLVDKFEKKILKVDVLVKTGVGVNVEGLKIGPVKVDVKCAGVTLSKIESEGKKCKTTVLNWIHIN